MAEPAAGWRDMTAGDLDDVVAIARLSFPDHFEERRCFAERLALYPRGCFVLTAGGAALGYLIAYPWTAAGAPPLNSLIHRLPDRPELIYLHDLAMHPDMRGQGCTRSIVERLAARSRQAGWPAIALVAVNQAAPFWQRMGFTAVETPAGLASYGDDGVYMLRRLAA